MASFKDIWEKYTEVSIKRRVYYKRLRVDGTYEASWTLIDDEYIPSDILASLNNSLPNESWKFGAVDVGSVSFNFISPFAQFASEEFSNSFFSGFIRDRSLIKIEDALVDPVTEVESTTEVVFLGLIDGDNSYTVDYREKIIALDSLIKLHDSMIADSGLADKVTNGQFVRDESWTKGTYWTIYGEYAQCMCSVSSTTSNLTQTVSGLDVGEDYYIEYEIGISDKGAVAVSLGSTTDATRSTIGVFRFSHTATATDETLTISAASATSADSDGKYIDLTIRYIKVFRKVTLSEGVYSIMNRPFFTNVFNVSDSSTYIDPPIDFEVDFSMYSDESVFDCFSALSVGMCVFYVDISDNYFYFVEPNATATAQVELLEQNERKKRVSNYKEGADRVVNSVTVNEERFYVANVTRRKSINVSIDGLIDSSNNASIGAHILAAAKLKKPYFNVEVPYAPFIRLLDKVNVQNFGFSLDTAARFGFARWNTDSFAQAIGIKISADVDWKVCKVHHDSTFTTKLELQKV